MKTIWKFPFNITDEFEIKMPEGAQILTVQTQSVAQSTSAQDQVSRAVEHPAIWALVDPRVTKVVRRFRCFGTGHPIPADGPVDVLTYVGTFQILGGAFVGHVFEVTQ